MRIGRSGVRHPTNHLCFFLSLLYRLGGLGQLPGTPLAGGLVVGPPVRTAIEPATASRPFLDYIATTLGAGHAWNGERSRVAALGKATTGDEFAVAAELDEQRLAALGAQLAGGLGFELNCWQSRSRIVTICSKELVILRVASARESPAIAAIWP